MSENVTLDVAIGLILLVLIASLLGSAIVEMVGGFFHRRSKNLWDTIDLMLGEMRMGGDQEKLVDRIYRQPFVTKLVQPKAQPLYPRELAGGEASLDLRA